MARYDVDGDEGNLFALTYLEYAVGTAIPEKVWFHDFTIALGRQEPGQFIYEVDHYGVVLNDVTPKPAEDHYYGGPGKGLIKVDDLGGFGFGTRAVTKTTPAAERLVEMFTAVMQAETALTEAREKVPSYTGQWDDADYYAEQLEARNRLVNALGELLGV